MSVLRTTMPWSANSRNINYLSWNCIPDSMNTTLNTGRALGCAAFLEFSIIQNNNNALPAILRNDAIIPSLAFRVACASSYVVREKFRYALSKESVAIRVLRGYRAAFRKIVFARPKHCADGIRYPRFLDELHESFTARN